MGLAKSEWFEAQEKGWSGVDKFVCIDCVDDYALQAVVETNLISNTCDYCGGTGQTPIAAPVDDLLEAIYATVRTYYHEPADAGVPWDGGYIVEPLDIEEVLHALGFAGHDDLVEDVISADMANGWVRAAQGHWASGHDHEVMLDSWSTFAHVVKHETRFHFGISPPSSSSGPQEVEPRQMLAVLGHRLQAFVKTLSAGTEVYRVRRRKRSERWSPDAKELGAPPAHLATAGRMNPAGIPYLYTAFDADTAVYEAGAGTRTTDAILVGRFKLTAPLLVVDLTQLPALPSVFDLDNKDDREKYLFAREFVKEISKPVTKNGQEHIDYVPSQVVCEYLAQVFASQFGQQLGGLIFPSSVCAGGRNLVVFPSERGWHQSYHGVAFDAPFKYRKIMGRKITGSTVSQSLGTLEPMNF